MIDGSCRCLCIIAFVFLLLIGSLAMDDKINQSQLSENTKKSCSVCAALSELRDHDDVNLPGAEAIEILPAAIEEVAQSETASDMALAPEPSKPEMPSGPSSGEVNRIMYYSTKAVNPSGNHMRITFEWWKDDKPYSDVIVEHVGSGEWAVGEGAWHACGNQKVRAKAEDEVTGATSDWSAFKRVSIYSIPQRANLNGPVRVRVNSWNEFSATTKDCCGDDKRIIRYKFNWGDGRGETIGPYKSWETAKTSHRWTSAGTYSVAVTAVNAYGKEAARSMPLRVTVV